MSGETITSEIGTTAAGAPPAAARVAMFTYGAICYLAFLGTFTYAIGFTGGLIVPKGVDDGTPGRIGVALAVNAALLSLFVVQHTVMARRRFKDWWTKHIPRQMERSTFVLATCVCLGLLFWQWQPVPTVVWDVAHPVARGAIWGLFALGWLIVLGSSFAISHFDLFGLRQSWEALIGRALSPITFRLVGPYRFVRHPLMVGFIIAFWSAPTMTVGHLFFAVMTTGYIFFGVWIEERSLMAQFGETYLDYRRRVGGFIPRLKPSR